MKPLVYFWLKEMEECSNIGREEREREREGERKREVKMRKWKEE